MKHFFTLILLFSCIQIFAQNPVGDGTESNPWQIINIEQLNMVRNILWEENSDKHVILMVDLDLTEYLAEGGEGYIKWGDKGWLPIGPDRFSAFWGTFDGNGHKIIGLRINRPDETYAGLFGYLKYGVIKNLTLEDVDVYGKIIVGSITSINFGGELINCKATGIVKGVSGSEIAGLTGFNSGNIIDCRVNVEVIGGIGQGIYGTGGLVGYNNGVIIRSHSSGNVIGGNEMFYVGGLVGRNIAELERSAVISECSSTGNVSGGSFVGGLVGDMVKSLADTADISKSFSSGNVTGTGDFVGGLVGYCPPGAKISNCYSLGDVIGINNIGGLSGYNKGLIFRSYTFGSVTGNSGIGALAGSNEGEINATYWDRNETIDGIGNNIGTIVNSIGLLTEEMQGQEAMTNMSLLDFNEFWDPIYVELGDQIQLGSLVLKSIDKSLQIAAQQCVFLYNLQLNSYPIACGTMEGGGFYREGDIILINANAIPGHEFMNWTGDIDYITDVNSSETTVIIPASSQLLNANFALINYTLSASTNTLSAGSIIIQPEKEFYTIEEEIVLEAIPAAGYEFVNWTGDTEYLSDAGTAASSLFFPSGSVSLMANFRLIDYQLTLVADLSGSTTINPSKDYYNIGDKLTLEAVPGTGYEFVDWTGDIEYLSDAESATSTVTFPAGNISLTANYSLINYQLTVGADPEGSTSVTPSKEYYNFRDEVTIEAVPEIYYKFDKWTGDTDLIQDVNSAIVTFIMPPGNVMLTANFISTISVENFKHNDFTLYPNPATDILNIKSESIIDEIFITDISGKIILHHYVRENTYVMPLTGIKNGTYLVKIVTQDGSAMRQLLIIN